MREEKISELISKMSLSQEDIEFISGNLARLLYEVFTSLDKDTGMRSWSIDIFCVDTNSQFKNKLTLQGKIWWICGCEKCVNYQANIAKNTSPLQYSYKFKNKHDTQLLW